MNRTIAYALIVTADRHEKKLHCAEHRMLYGEKVLPHGRLGRREEEQRKDIVSVVAFPLIYLDQLHLDSRSRPECNIECAARLLGELLACW